jgi:tRNA-specific 2-thiouridylase
MAGTKKKVLIALSGGVDSSTAAAILLEKGYDCSGVFMITSEQSDKAQSNAEEMAKRLGIRLYILDLRKDFEKVLEYFISEYKKGRTPNPCVYCNKNIKFGKLLDFAKDKGAEFFATGHYARIMKDGSGNYCLYAADTPKDQSYALAMINREILSNIIFPLGEYSKQQTQEMAAKFGLDIKDRCESQEICFIPNDDYIAVLERRCPELVRRGNIIDSSGKILGEHKGTHRFTIGQRRGLRVAMGLPYYVTKIDSENNTVTLGPKSEVLSKKLTAENVNWLINKSEKPFRAKVKVRYNSKAVSAQVTPFENSAIVEFDEQVSAVTPGQLAVFYIQDEFGSKVAGGGWIDSIACRS